MNLEERFYKLICHWSKDDKLISELWAELYTFYSESSRGYHNLNHIKALFGFYDTYKGNLSFPLEMGYAIFYHDIIYNIWRKDNELKSAELDCKYLSNMNLQDDSIKRVFNLIMVTKTHISNTDTDEKWMIDFDLAILGLPWNLYNQYIKLIRKEYSKVPNILYKKGRRRVLKHFLEKTKVYQTKTFQDLYEIQAKQNLNKELQLL